MKLATQSCQWLLSVMELAVSVKSTFTPFSSLAPAKLHSWLVPRGARVVRLRAAQDVRAHVRPPLHDSTTPRLLPLVP